MRAFPNSIKNCTPKFNVFFWFYQSKKIYKYTSLLDQIQWKVSFTEFEDGRYKFFQSLSTEWFSNFRLFKLLENDV